MRLSYKVRIVDALAPEVDERRGQRRYAPGRCKQPLIRGFLNGETLRGDKSMERLRERLGKPKRYLVETTQGSETSQYLEENKSNEIPSVVASERGTA
jgi:hypothetical protein